MGDPATYTVPERMAGWRADRAVAALAGVSRAVAHSLVEEGEVRVDGTEVEPRTRLTAGSRLDVVRPAPAPPLAAEDVAFEVRYEDEALAVVDKPAGVVVHPGAGRRTGTLASGLLARWPELAGVGEPDRWGIVHRLDRGTSGLLIVAKTGRALRRLRAGLAERRIHRGYLALVWGRFAIERGAVDAPLGRDERHPTRFRVTTGGRPALTRYRRLAEWLEPPVALVEVELDTGRTHQIRVHLASITHPVVGDPVYGRPGTPPVDPGRPWLHAARLAFPHPDDGRPVVVVAPLPADLAGSLTALGPPELGVVPSG